MMSLNNGFLCASSVGLLSAKIIHSTFTAVLGKPGKRDRGGDFLVLNIAIALSN